MRSFPLWWYPKRAVLTNLSILDEFNVETIFVDQQVTLQGLSLKLHKIDPLGDITHIKPNSKTITQVVNETKSILTETCIDFFTQYKNVNLFVTGGIDTMLLQSIIDSSGLHCNTIDREHFEYDLFTNKNIEQLQELHWAYKQIHHWRGPNILMTGGCGDEFMMRGPNMVGLYCAWHNIDILDILRLTKNQYHSVYYLKDKNVRVFDDLWKNRWEWQDRLPTYKDLVEYILNYNANDHQHWHLGNTLTFTPFKNIDLTKLLLQLSPEQLTTQFTDANVNKQIIYNLSPNRLKEVSEFKNIMTRGNLVVK
jgi:hypothetical protein